MKALSWTFGTVAVLLCAYVGWHSLHYLDPGFPGSDFIMRNLAARPWLPLHAGFATVALLLGPAQFAPAIRRRWPRLHRWMGRAYVVSALAAGATGLALALGTVMGPVAAAGFLGLAVATLVSAAQAWRLAVARRFDAHRRWVVRSYAVIFAGVTFRLWLPLSMIAGLDFAASYGAVAFLAWVPNLVVAELYLARGGLRAPAALTPAHGAHPARR